MKDSLHNVLAGSTGLVAVEVTPVIVENLATQATGVIQILTQLAITIVTIISLFRKKKGA